VEAIDKWLEGFEAELREMKSKFKRQANYTRSCGEVKYDLIREILGE